MSDNLSQQIRAQREGISFWPLVWGVIGGLTVWVGTYSPLWGAVAFIGAMFISQVVVSYRRIHRGYFATGGKPKRGTQTAQTPGSPVARFYERLEEKRAKRRPE